ncbi:MAG: phospholipid carrier-dependent glycosyltransferase, partial [Deltaproteobacteria bacterium]|nr:phospholipid carrier-dependent glycosyltransferase [Deltaproteobacteria bacterium]
MAQIAKEAEAGQSKGLERARRRFLPALLLLALLSFAAGLFGAGMSYRAVLTPHDSGGFFKGIRPDRWISDGARILLPELASRGNRLILTFGPWHPPGKPTPRLRLEVCGESSAEFTVGPGHKEVVFLRGTCQPRSVVFRVLNPFQPSLRDRRRLGPQLVSAQVTSRLGVPIVEPLLLFKISGAIFLLAIIVFFTVSPAWSKWIALGVPAVAFIFLARASDLDFGLISQLWICFTALASGVLLAAKLVPGGVKNIPRPFLRDRLEDEPRSVWICLTLLMVLGFGALLRFYGLDFGLPEAYHPDEMQKHGVIMRMVAAADLNPRYFKHPSLLLYLTYFMNSLWHHLGMSGEWQASLVLAGRAVSALAGTFSILLVYCIGRRIFSSGSGLLGAAVLAAAPLHVTCSRYLKEDALLTVMVLGTVLLVLKAVQEERKWLLWAAGLVAGFAAGTKYPGVLCFAILAGAPWLKSGTLSPNRKWLVYTFIAILMLPLGFLISTPYSILDYQTFVRDFMYEKWHMSKGHTSSIDAWSQYWMYHFSRSLLPGMHVLPTLVGVAGLGVLLWRRRMEDLYVVALVLLFYLPAEWVKAKPEPQPERYILPVLPFLALGVGEAVRMISLSRVRVLWPLLAALVVGLSAQRSLQLASELRPDTRELMAVWINENLNQGSRICMDWRWYTPVLPP